MGKRILLLKLLIVLGGILSCKWGTPGSHEHSLVLDHATQCPIVITDTILLREGEHVKVVNLGFKKKPTHGSKVVVLPYPEGSAVELRIISVSYQKIIFDHAENGYWRVELEEASHTSLRNLKAQVGRRPEFPSDVAVLWPAPEKAPQIVTVRRDELPEGVYPQTTKTAIDLNGDGSADALMVQFPCEDRRMSWRVPVDYTCSEKWQKIDNKWRLCDMSSPL